jgi:putative membrane protein
MNKLFSARLGILFMGLMALSPAWSDSNTAAGLPPLAARVLSDLHQANQDEIEMGRMAKEKGNSSEVRSYGAQLVKDHEDADQQVKELAKKENITLFSPRTQGLMAHRQAVREEKVIVELSTKSGPAFDKAFTQAIVDDHKRDIAKLEKVEKSLKSPDVHELVVKLLPTMQQHLEIAEQLQRNG